MNDRPGLLRRIDDTGVPSVIARLAVGFMFVYSGINKAAAPYDFLKLIRDYGIFADSSYLPMNTIAIVLPWLEILCGILIVGGIALRGTALVVAGMLVPFTITVALRAVGIHNDTGTPFCGIEFDCGCGVGVVNICHKIVENSTLLLLSLLLVWSRTTLAFPRLGKPQKVSVI